METFLDSEPTKTEGKLGVKFKLTDVFLQNTVHVVKSAEWVTG